MKALTHAVAVSVALICTSLTSIAQTAPAPATPEKRTHQWWNDRPVGGRRYTVNAKKMPLISVKANRFVDPQGNIVLFRGLAISDPDKLEMQGHWNKEHFAKVKEMGTKVVRIPVYPVAWRERTPGEYLKLLDQAVEWCTDLDMYIMLDWHSIGNLMSGLFQDPMYETSTQETYNFWRVISRHFTGHNTIAFYEFFNEPTPFRGQLGKAPWGEWKRINEELITIVHAYDRETIPLVACFDWAYDLTPLREEPIAAAGIGYVTHPYENKRPKPWEPKWEEDFGFAASQYPIIATEFGGGGRPGAAVEPDSYMPSIIKYLEGRGGSCVVWCFDPQWGPSLISDWNYTLSGSGEFFKQAMLAPPPPVGQTISVCGLPFASRQA